MRNLLISLCIVAVFMEISGLIWTGKDDKPSDALLRLSESPQPTLANPLQNGYFLLLGFSAAAGTDPVQVGYDMWLEAEARRGRRLYNYEKPGRAELRASITAAEALPAWDAPDPLTELQKDDALFRTAISRYAILVQRYERWLNMPFEDWGFGQGACPRFEEMLIAHRLYVATGFAKTVQEGASRLWTDLAAWRRVLADAKTLPLKVAALVMVDDDARFLSRLLGRATIDNSFSDIDLAVLQPLTTAEYSLRWPIQNEFALSLRQDGAPIESEALIGKEASDRHREWLARTAGLRPDAFQRVVHPTSHEAIRMAFDTPRTREVYAAYYDAVIKASETIHHPLPKFREIARTASRTLFDSLMHPFEFEPDWELFSQRLVETDARLRLAALQILLRKPAPGAAVPARLAEAGSRYFDPFTGLPMLWNATRERIYSVGKDGLDDGGDSGFDISVPIRLSIAEDEDERDQARVVTVAHPKKTTAIRQKTSAAQRS